MHFKRVLLPEPLSPMIPNVVPTGISKLTSRSAQNSWYRARRPRMTVAFSESLRSSYSRNSFETSSIRIAASTA